MHEAAPTLMYPARPPAQARARPSPGARRQRSAAYLLSVPAVVTLLLLVFLPALGVILISLTDWRVGETSLRFVGLENYVALLTDDLFLVSFGNTLIYVFIVVPGSIALGLVVALLIEAGRSGRALYQTIHFLPVLSTMAAMALAWEALLHPFIGIANAVLGLFGVPPQDWLTDPNLVIYTLATVGVWQHSGFCMILFIAGLRTIPAELFDAADVDGADGPWDRFATVIWPLLGPVTVFVTVLTAIRAFQVFDIVAILTRGGPGTSSHVLMYTIYTEGFQYFNSSYASALTVVFLIILMVFTIAHVRLSDRRTHYS